MCMGIFALQKKKNTLLTRSKNIKCENIDVRVKVDSVGNEKNSAN